MMKNFKVVSGSRILPLLVLALVFSGACKKDKFQGPELKPASQEFEVIDDFKSTEDKITFFVGQDPTLGFSVGFNEEVSWEMEVVGLESGASKEYKGNSTGFNSEDIVWDGRSSSINFYKPWEYVQAKLKVLGVDSVFTVDSIRTLGAYTYHNRTLNGVKHIVVDHYEKAEGTNVQKLYSAVSAAQAVDQADNYVDFKASESTLIEGDQGFHMKGTDINNNGWIGSTNNTNLLDFLMVDNVQGLLIDSGVSPEDLFFNLYIYGTGKVNSAIELKVYELDVKEDEYGNPVNTRDGLRAYIDSGDVEGNAITRVPYLQSENDGWIYDIEVTWTGWKLVSIPYSIFRAANDLNSGGGGDRIKESWRIGGMAMSLLSYPTTGKEVEAYVDLLTITLGGKFQQ